MSAIKTQFLGRKVKGKCPGREQRAKISKCFVGTGRRKTRPDKFSQLWSRNIHDIRRELASISYSEIQVFREEKRRSNDLQSGL